MSNCATKWPGACDLCLSKLISIISDVNNTTSVVKVVVSRATTIFCVVFLFKVSRAEVGIDLYLLFDRFVLQSGTQLFTSTRH